MINDEYMEIVEGLLLHENKMKKKYNIILIHL